MSDDDPLPLLDLGPALLAKKRRDCKHRQVLIDNDVDELECADCGAPINPFTYLRMLASDEEQWRKLYSETYDEYIKLRETTHQEYLKFRERLQAQLEHHQAEVNHLIDVKNRLWNESTPEGRPLGSVAARTRKRRVATGKPTQYG